MSVLASPLRHPPRVDDPPIARWLFHNTRASWLWLPIRVAVGWVWLQAGLEKAGDPAWSGDHAGAALTGFIKGALAKTGGAHPDVQGWYAGFLRNTVLPHAATWGHVVTAGEILVGIALILGVLTGIAAFVGSFMNMNYLLAGAVSLNPFLFAASVLLVLAWKNAGWIGGDRWLLPALGTPWSPGSAFRRRRGLRH